MPTGMAPSGTLLRISLDVAEEDRALHLIELMGQATIQHHRKRLELLIAPQVRANGKVCRRLS